MLSLKEEISSFRQEILKLNLEGYTSLFQSHRSQQPSPTLAEVVGENHFLVESVKMMGSVFLNYCWLNERVYSKIIEHQLGFHDAQAKLNTLTHAFQRKLDDSLRNFKTLHEDSLAQNRKNKEIVEVGLKSICAEIQTKVTDAQLNEKIREILRKYDQGDLLDEAEEQTLSNSNSGSYFISSPEKASTMMRTISHQEGERKVGKVGYEDYYRLKDTFEAQIASLKKQIHDAKHDTHLNKEQTVHCAALLQLHQAEIKRNKTDITKLQNQHKFSAQSFDEQIQRIRKHFEDKVSEQEWKRRLSIFQMRTIEPIRTQCNDSIAQLRAQVKKVREETYLKTNSAEGQLLQLGKEMSDFKAKVAKEVEDVAVLQLKFTELQHHLHHETAEIAAKTDTFIAEAKKNGKELEKSLRKQVNQLRTTIQKLSNSVQEKAFKAIAKKIESCFQCFETDLMETRELSKNLTTGLALANEEISSMKDLLSKKANFTDVVHYIESKADKNDFREIRSRLNDNAQVHPVMVRQLSETMAARHEHSLIESPKRMKPLINTPRTQFIAITNTRDSRRDKSTSRADLEGTARKLLIRDSKKRVMKSYSSLISDLRH